MRRKTASYIIALLLAVITGLILLWLEVSEMINQENSYWLIIGVCVGVFLIIVVLIWGYWPTIKSRIKRKRINKPKTSDVTKQREEWWEQYRPSCVIVKVDYLKITKDPNVYHFELPIDVKYTSRDSRHSTGMDCTTILLNVSHAGEGREQRPYILQSSTMPRRIEPLGEGGGFKIIQPKWDLPRNTPWVVRYTFIGEVEVLPLVDEETSCIITHIGIPRIYNVNINKPLKIEDSKFPISVIDGKFLVKIDKQNY